MNKEVCKKPCLQTSLIVVLLGFLAALIISTIILSCVPPVSRDALAHHLAVPKLYLKHGSIYEIPSISFSYYPMNLELLYIIPLFFGNDIIPKFIHFSFALMTAWLIFCYLKKRLDTLFALLGALFFLSVPIIVKLSITVYVDLGLIFFSTAALIYLLKWIEDSLRLKYLIISALFCGLSLGTKYNGLIVLLLLSFFVPFIYSRFSEKSALASIKAIWLGMAFMLIALFVFSPWMIRNYKWTGNPVFPLYNRLFNPPNKVNSNVSSINKGDITPKKSLAEMGPFVYRKVIYKEKWWEIALIPARIFFQGQDDTPQFFDGKLSPFLFILPFFAFCRFKTDSSVIRIEKMVFLIFSVLFLSFVFFHNDMRIRWISPTIPPFVILSIFGLNDLGESIKKRFPTLSARNVLGLITILGLLPIFLNAAYIIEQFGYVDPISFISGKVSRVEYIERYRPEYAAIRFVNENLPEDAMILCVFMGGRRYYCDRDVVFTNAPFHSTIKSTESAEKILIYLKKRGITHLLVNNGIFNNWARSVFNEREKKMILEFYNKYARLLLDGGGYGLFQLL